MYFCRIYEYEIHAAVQGPRIEGPGRRADDRSRRRPHADLHARRHGRYGQGAFPPRRARRGARPDHPGQHLPPLPPPRHGDHRAGRRRAPLLDVGGADAHRQRRLPGLLARGVPQTQGGGVPLPLAHRRIEAPVHPRERDRHRADDRRRHHDGLRRVPPGRRAPRVRGQVAGPDRAVARPLLQPLPPDCPQIRPLPGAVPHRAGVRLPRPAGPGGRKRETIRRRRICHRRTGRG